MLKVARLQQRHVVEFVSGNDEGGGLGGKGIAAGGALARPGIGRETGQQGLGGVADGLVFLHKRGPRARVGLGMGGEVVLFKAWEGRLVAAADAERAIGEDALAVGEMVEDLFDGPLAGGMGDGLRFGDAAPEGQERGGLRGERGGDVASGDEVNIFAEVGSVAGGLGTGHLEILQTLDENVTTGMGEVALTGSMRTPVLVLAMAMAMRGEDRIALAAKMVDTPVGSPVKVRMDDRRTVKGRLLRVDSELIEVQVAEAGAIRVRELAIARIEKFEVRRGNGVAEGIRNGLAAFGGAILVMMLVLAAASH